MHCEFNQLSKHCPKSYVSQPYQKSHSSSFIHIDLWGPSNISNVTGSKWFIPFIDDHAQICWVYLLKEKSKAKEIFKNFNAMINTQFQTKIQIFCTNNGTEYFNSILGPYLHEHGIIHQSSCSNTTTKWNFGKKKTVIRWKLLDPLCLQQMFLNIFWGKPFSLHHT